MSASEENALLLKEVNDWLKNGDTTLVFLHLFEDGIQSAPVTGKERLDKS